MASISEVGASEVKVSNYKCSIKKVTLSTKWKAPGEEVDEEVSTTIYDSKNGGKTLYLVTSPKGKTVTLKMERDEGNCHRQSHKTYLMTYDDYKKEESGKEKENDKEPEKVSYSRTESKWNTKGIAIAAGKDALLSTIMPIVLPFNLIRTPLKLEEEIKNESKLKIKCFEIGGAFEALKYWRLPVPIEKDCVTRFSHNTCKEGLFRYQIVSYPDISFELELSTEANDDPNDSRLFCMPTLTAKTAYNAKQCRIELEVNFEKGSDEYVKFKYIEQNTVVSEFSSEVLQELPAILKNPLDFFRAVKRILNLDFIHDLIGFDISKYKAETKIVSFEPVLPQGSISVKGQYHTSKDLTKIGKYYEINMSFDPLIGVTCTIDLLYWILTSVSGGAYAGIYVLIKNLKPILEKLLGDDIERVPVSADVYLKLEITGKINSSIQCIIDTIQEENEEKKNYSITPVEGVLEVDLKAGVKASVDILYIFNGEVELSGSASSGISLQFGLEEHFDEGRGLVVPMTILFNGMKIKYCVKACAGLKKVKIMKKYLGIDKEGEVKVWDKKELYSHEFEFLKD